MLNRKLFGLSAMSALALMATACGNPAIDPNQTYTAKGVVADASGMPIQNAQVTFLKYYSDSRLLEPSLEQLFSEDATVNPPAGLGIEVVASGTTDANGEYKFEVLGEKLAQPGGYTTAEGLVEGASTLVVVKDPTDASDRTGVATYPKEFMRSDFIWDAGTLKMWDSGAEADVTGALTTGLVTLRWTKIERGNSMVKNTYRIWVGGDTGPALLILCSQGDELEGGCGQDPADATKLVRSISAFSLRTYYANADGSFDAYVMARGVQYRYASRFSVTNIPDLTDTRDPVGVEGIWAVGPTSDQELTGTPAVDGNPATRQEITNNATAIYAKLPLSVVTDAGVLNTLVKNAASGCLVLEFSATVFNDLAAAKNSSAGDWSKAGKFCGETGGRDEVSALAGFDTAASQGKTAGWMRLVAVPDSAGAVVEFQAVGEVAIYKARL
ncbi:MAG: hypothetical protein KC933_30640 [Myxococcales bacterium]|nr:hypothetical protein [Myxococcales bacterium]MCB9645143.1 hypothetical protein [Deltaproteobacteria bacterium]